MIEGRGRATFRNIPVAISTIYDGVMTRVMVIGNAGGGKSRLARRIAELLGLPYHAVDLMQWRPGWVPVPERDFSEAQAGILASGRWVIDGFGPWDSLEARFGAADTIILVDYPLWCHFWWATKRQLHALLFGREDGPPGCPMWRVTFRLYAMMWHLHRTALPVVRRMVEEKRGAARIVRIERPADLSAFEAELGMAR